MNGRRGGQQGEKKEYAWARRARTARLWWLLLLIAQRLQVGNASSVRRTLAHTQLPIFCKRIWSFPHNENAEESECHKCVCFLTFGIKNIFGSNYSMIHKFFWFRKFYFSKKSLTCTTLWLNVPLPRTGNIQTWFPLIDATFQVGPNEYAWPKRKKKTKNQNPTNVESNSCPWLLGVRSPPELVSHHLWFSLA